jgi:hypothetical protein
MSRLSRGAKAIAFVAGLVAPPALAGPVSLSDAQLGAASAGADFSIVNRVSDQMGVAPVTDPLLVNSWGLAEPPGATFLWVANNGSDTSTLYNTAANFSKAPLNVSVPGDPTGIVFVGIPNAFNVSEGGKMGNTLFAFATEGGQIEGWSPTVDVTNAIVKVDASASGAIFKGLTLASVRGITQVNRNVQLPFNGGVIAFPTPVVQNQPMLIATDFAHGVVNGYDSNFNKVLTFADPQFLPNYAPFNVENLNGLLYVTFAQRDPGSKDENHGPGLGFIDVFDMGGHFLRRLTTGGPLNAPWGLAIAPASFGKFAGALLVGNFGDGQINAFNPVTGQFLGKLDVDNIDGLWALRNGPNGTITFSAGPDDENHGLVGSIGPTNRAWGADEMISMAAMHH